MKKNEIKYVFVPLIFISLIFSCNEKNVQNDKIEASRTIIAQIIIDLISEESTTSPFNIERYKELAAKSNRTIEEKSEFQEMNKILVQELGPDFFVNQIKEATKGLSRTETLAVEAKILTDYFDEKTGRKIKDFLNIGRLKPAVEDMDSTLKDQQEKR